ncbi:hypothetical protein CCR75_000053 [Bremia lactucae]|uniref:Uncharacterized protein n=1 Tax=Bremia lactucae TaxID=4779 RepID=A0A976FHA8_BRELC|nr:hypothetical protein CCR75_000053 [Bremia lactucae]
MMLTSLPLPLPMPKRGMERSASFHDYCESSGCNSVWLRQRSRIQATAPISVIKNRTSPFSTMRPSAASYRDAESEMLHGKMLYTDRDCKKSNATDSERDYLDMEEQLTAFVEFNATDLENLDIIPSQDFKGDEEKELAAQSSQYIETSSWEDITDVNQFPDEASEVFDSVIHDVRPDPMSISAGAFHNYRRKNKSGYASPSLFRSLNNIKSEQTIYTSSDDSEGSLSDGFDVAENVTRELTTTPTNIAMQTNSSRGDSATDAKVGSIFWQHYSQKLMDVNLCKPQWMQRCLNKRNSSFRDNSPSCVVNRQLLLMASVAHTSESMKHTVIELKNGFFDASDDVKHISTRDRSLMSKNHVPLASKLTFAHKNKVKSSSLSSKALYLGAFQPRLVRKRRKSEQLTLDGFIRAKIP